MAGILIGGWDRRKGGQIYSIPIGGMCVRQAISIGGSGSSYIYGFVDANFKPNMKQEECVDLVTKCNSVVKFCMENFIPFIFLALTLAMSRDGSSGGVARIGIITEKGVERRLIEGNDLPKFFEN